MTWNLDAEKRYSNDREIWIKKHGYDKGIHSTYKIGQVVQFMTGYNDDILAQAKIKGIDGNDLYVYNDCYWYPITADKIKGVIS